ncbi:MAG: anti-sigma factor family protein [Phycisphaerae bacterium]
MITCQHARQLFDRYLDGELSPSLQAELHAHQLSCSACQTELAMLEACGDVIMLDRRREPKLSDSFTDRVLLARRAQLAAQPRRRSWGRTFVVVGSPLAAAASIVLCLTLMWPRVPSQGRTDVAVRVEVPPGSTTAVYGGSSGQENPDPNLPATQMPSSALMESILTTVVERTSRTVERAKNNFSQLELLLQQALAETNAQVAAQETGSLRRSSSGQRSADQQGTEQELLNSPGTGSENGGDSGSDQLLEPL